MTDITDSGQIFNAMSSYAGLDELEPGNGIPKFDPVLYLLLCHGSFSDLTMKLSGLTP